MYAIQDRNTFTIHPNQLSPLQSLPPAIYILSYSQSQGFYLTLHQAWTSLEEMSGVLPSKIFHILNSYSLTNRSLGVIFSGKPGMGKTMAMKKMAMTAIEKNYPVLIIDRYYENISNFIESIDQDIIILFDEFEKTYDDDDQEELLSLFDGLSTGHKLFIISCNDENNLSSFIKARPGRFHYHIRFPYPSAAEVNLYLTSHLSPTRNAEMPKIVRYSKFSPLSYDSLRAICFELNNYPDLLFEDIIDDLNVSRISTATLSLKLEYNSMILCGVTRHLNLLTPTANPVTTSLYLEDTNLYMGCLEYSAADISYDESNSSLYLSSATLVLKDDSSKRIEVKDIAATSI